MIDSTAIGQPDHPCMRLCRALPSADGTLLSAFFHGRSATVLQDEACREIWRDAVPATTDLLICSAAWQQAGGGEAGQGWEIVGWPVWYERRRPTARLLSFGERE